MKLKIFSMNCKRTLLIFFLAYLFSWSGYSKTRDMAKEQLIIKQLESLDPTLVNTFNSATAAMDSLNYPLADSLYTLVYMKVPDFDPVLRRLGTIRFELGKHREGIDL